MNEREARKALSDEVGKLRDENITLKRELIMANKNKIQLQNKLKDTIKKEGNLQKTVEEVKNVLKEKKMMFSELENQLTEAVGSSAASSASSSGPIELPPIVVKPNASGNNKSVATTSSAAGALKGEVLAVNKNDNFVIIDLGENSGVKPGFKFDVVRSGTAIGNIEVIETRKEISAADIKNISKGYTIHEGDTVVARE